MDLEVGQIVDGYRITGVLGRGGMGVVYKAEDTALSRDVALKVILANLTRDDQFIRRFQTEARTLAQVDSPYIVRVHALRETDAGWFIVMEYVQGGTVADLLENSEHGLDVAEALPIIRQMFQAFEHAHGAGIIHRDIKPENVMLTKTRRVKIADFGLAKQSSPDTLATVTQGMMGTLYYMSPEQVRGLGEVDHRSDLWALGVVMYEMLTGRRPFKSTYEAAVLYAILNDEPEPFTEADGDIPDGLKAIIFRLLEKDQTARFQTAREVLDALDALGSGARAPARAEARRPDADATVAAGTASHADRNPSAASPGEAVTDADVDTNESLLRRIRDKISIKRFAQGFTLLLAVTAAIINFYGLISSRADASSNDRMLTVSTIPPDASVLVNEREAGRTPLERIVPGTEEETRIRIRKEGYIEIDTVLALGERHAFTLSPVPDDPSDEDEAVTSDEGADAPDDETTPNVDEQTETPVTTPPQRGTLTVSVDPDGDAYVDGDEIETGTPVSLAAGRHEIRVTHLVHGELIRTVDVPAGGSADVTCYMVGDVNVYTDPWSTITIDGEVTEHTAPGVLQLGLGTYDIGVRKFNFTAEQVEGPEGPITIAGSCDEKESYRLRFQLTEQ